MSAKTDMKWKSRNFLITLNQVEYFGELKEYMKHFTTFRYAIASKEKAPTTGHEHIHIYCQYIDKTTIKKSKLYGARVDVCQGSAQANITYVRKTNEPEKAGDIIWEEGEPAYKGRLSIADVEKMSKSERKILPLVYFKTVEMLNMKDDVHVLMDEMFKEVTVKYIFGKSGLGKTYLASQWLKELNATKFDIVNYENGFWNGVSDKCPFAFYDDFRDTDMPPVMFIKFIDYTIKNLNVKGGYVKNKYRYIFITSIKDPRLIYGDRWEEKKQWLRRMEIYEFTAYNKYKKLDIKNYDEFQ